MLVFMNAKGQYLKWRVAENTGFVAGAVHHYEWVTDLNAASLANQAPTTSVNKWYRGVSPHKEIVASLEAKETRIVTLVQST